MEAAMAPFIIISNDPLGNVLLVSTTLGPIGLDILILKDGTP